MGVDDPKPDIGRGAISDYEGDIGKFRTPTLREIARTSPYMHDGRFKTLEEVVDYYLLGGNTNDHLDQLMNVFPLSDQEKADLVTFLKEGLSSDDYPDIQPPELPE